MANPEFTDFSIEIDNSDVKAWDGEYQQVAPGDYVVDVTHLEQKTAESSGNTYIKAEFTIAESEAQPTEEAGMFAGSKLWNNYTLTQKALGRLVALQMACGANLQRFVASEIMGSRIMVTVVHQKSQDYTDKDGNPKEGGIQSRVTKERQLPQPEAKTEAKKAAVTPPPAATKPAAAKNGAAARRA